MNLKRVVDDVIDLCQPLAKRGVKLVNDLRENVPFVLGDTGRIIQVWAVVLPGWGGRRQAHSTAHGPVQADTKAVCRSCHADLPQPDR